MYQSTEIGRTWTVHKDKLPDLTNLKYVEQSIIVLSSVNDSLQTTVNKEVHADGNKHYYISLLDIAGNKIVYLINEEDFEQSKELVRKVLRKKVFLVKSSNDPEKTIQISVYKDLKLITANYYSSDYVDTETFPIEVWFKEEIDDLSLSDIELFNKIP